MNTTCRLCQRPALSGERCCVACGPIFRSWLRGKTLAAMLDQSATPRAAGRPRDTELGERKTVKRGTPRHPKVAHLCELLRVKLPAAVGYLELLWHFTAEFAPQGDIGRFTDKRIEAGKAWIPAVERNGAA
jgi:hypothetical protein